MNINCKLFGHKIKGLNTKRFFAWCDRCNKGLKVSYDMSYGQTLVTGDYGNQKNFCWCDCGNELCSSQSYLGNDVPLMSALIWERFKCSKCGKVSDWDFNMPVPIKIR